MATNADSSSLLRSTKIRRGNGAELRRLSSSTARPVDLYSGNVTVVPARHLSSKSDAHETALALERAKSHLAEESDTSTPDGSTGISTPEEPEEGALQTTDSYAFAFDIDGVLIKGGEVIPEAIEAMKVLNGQNEYNIKVLVHFPCPRACGID